MPDDVVEGSTASVSDDVTFLSEGEVETSETEGKEEGTEEETAESEAPSDEEPEPETVEVKEVAHPFDRPSIKQVQEKFPDLFKKFPQLRDSYFREAEYSKIFPTIEDAKDAARDFEVLHDVQEAASQGRVDELFKFLDEHKSLDRVASQLFPALVRTKGETFWLAANPLIEDVARSMFKKGEKEKNENLQNAARHLADYFFGDLAVAEGTKSFVKQPDPKIEAESKAEEKYDLERYNTFRNSVRGDVATRMNTLITDGDKLSSLSPFLQGVVVDKIIEQVGKTLEADSDHMKYMDSLWDRAKRNGRKDEDKGRIISAYLARAKSLIPSLRSKFLSEINGKGPAASADKLKKVATASSRTDTNTSGKPTGTKGADYNPKKIDYHKTSDLDILNDDIHYKN